MLAVNLKQQILDFVRSFSVVKERQIRKFFSDWGYGSVNAALKMLLDQQALIRHQEEYLSTARKLPAPLSSYQDVFCAIDVMLTLQSQKIRWYSRTSYPVELIFGTIDNAVYDVAVFNADDWAFKYSMIPNSRQKMDEAEEDPVQHVAVVPNDSLAARIDSLGFCLYAVIDKQTGKAELFSFYDSE
ncbi:MAG TPA: hypothetical protein IAC31_00105 [Candidatus Faecousia intestinigallinarum]|nr:hypothetical protein [Candidatus Faecousia intestinigallinarum]